MADARKIQMYDPDSKMHKDKVRREILRKILVCVVLVVVLLPFYVAIMYAFKPANEITANRLVSLRIRRLRISDESSLKTSFSALALRTASSTRFLRFCC